MTLKRTRREARIGQIEGGEEKRTRDTRGREAEEQVKKNKLQPDISYCGAAAGHAK